LFDCRFENRLVRSKSRRPIAAPPNRQKILTMIPRTTHHAKRATETEARPNAFLWLTFHAIAFLSAATYWLKFKRVCAWHQPAPRRMGGNPFARRVTHGLCAGCFARVSAEIISHGETDLRVSVTKARQQGGPSLPAPPARNCAVPARLQRSSAGDPDTTRPTFLRGKSF
jgi:hypothetical protein